ncbi:MAG: LPS-assembly protein LptD [Proteobacteria bacterium]|nr:LPS-assembly protein LptD [Pseudomonadota bacterium]
MKTIHYLYVFLFILLCCRVPSAGAAGAAIPDENVHISADRMSQNGADGIYTAEGNVVVLWNGMNLAADQVRYAATTHILHATGSVVMTKGTTVLKGKTLVLYMDSGRAEMDSTLLKVPESGMTIASDKLIRIDENVFTALSTELTSCDMPDPSWKISADRLNVNLLGYATGRNVIFYVKNIPVLYLPWMAFPVVLEKRSGLLFPHFGYSNKRGAQLDIPAYLVISPSQDLQLDLDMMSRRGVGVGLDYRYIRSRDSEGHISPYTIYDQLEDRWRWQLAMKHKEVFSSSANLRVDVNAISDRTFLGDFGDKSGNSGRQSDTTTNYFGEKSGEYNRQSNDTTVNALKTWQHYAVSSYLRYSQDLYAPNDQATLQTLPSFAVAGVRQSVFAMPLYFDLDGSADNLYRESGTSGQRLSLFPRFTLLQSYNSYLRMTLFTGAHIRGYATDKQDSSSGSQSSDGDLLPEAGARLSTSLTRIYDTNFQLLKKVRHEFIPEISYDFVTGHVQQRLPFYDYTDRIIRQNMITLSATSVINGKFVSGDTTEYRDISRIRLSADYAIEGGRRDLLTLVESQRPWSDLILESETMLSKQMRVTFDTRYNLYENRLSTAVAGIEADDQQGNSIGAGYQMARNELEYFEGHFSTKMIKPLNLSYTARYSFDRGNFLESLYAAEYRHKCWSVNLAFHQRLGNQSYTVNFNLAGLGSN